MVSVSFDPEAKTLYIQVSNLRPAKTLPVGEGKYIDVSESGKAVGFEIIFPRSTSKEAIDAIIGLKDEEQIKLLQ
jgi:uncharacterized protein YuzE